MSPAMICSPATPVESARSLIGTKFRLHGHDAVNGVDCVGLIAIVFDWQAKAPAGYALRGDRVEAWIDLLDGLATRRIGALCEGDILLLQAGPMQFHLGVWSGSGLIHADASVRRVVETPGPLRWPLIASWFKSQES